MRTAPLQLKLLCALQGLAWGVIACVFVLGTGSVQGQALASARSRPGVIFTDEQTLAKVSGDPSYRMALNQAPPQNIDLMLPNVDDPARVLTARDLTQIGSSFRRLSKTHGIRIYLWIGAADEVPRMVAESTRLVRARPVETQIAAFLVAGDGTRRACMFSNLLVDKHDLETLKALVSRFPSMSEVGKRGEAVAGFIDAFEQLMIGGTVEQSGLPVAAEKMLEEQRAATTTAAPETAAPETASLPAVAPSPASSGGGTPLWDGSLQGVSVDPAVFPAPTPGAPEAAVHIEPEPKAAATGNVAVPMAPEKPKEEGKMHFGKGWKLLFVIFALVISPLVVRPLFKLFHWFKASRREMPERTVLARPGVPLLSAAAQQKTASRVPRQRVNLRPRAPFKPR